MKERQEQTGSRRTMEKCGICGKDVPEQPSVTSEGNCNMCGAKLGMTRER